jgi:hypothetical protein
VKCGFLSAAIRTMQWNSVKMNMLTGTVYNFLKSSLRTTQHVTALSRSVESGVSTRC